ncbi:MAG: hypothetical protein HY959_10780 [Ignavibacteriae bacterium]|nr:hypothetical protein [Ignavibacteriota bacterium]
MRTFKFIIPLAFLLSFVFIYSCKKGEDQNEQIPQQQEVSSDKEKELKDKEEFLRIKEQQLREWEDNLSRKDSTGKFKDKKTDVKDTVKTAKDTSKVKTKKDDKVSEKEKELNKRLDNPITAVNDYLEYIKRGIADSKTFDANMKKASENWESRSAESFKKSYKNTKKFVITQEPSVISQKDGTASVKVKVKQTQTISGKEEEKEITVTYNLVADKNGKWKIKSNVVK